MVDPFFLIGGELDSHELGVDELLSENPHGDVCNDKNSLLLF